MAIHVVWSSHGEKAWVGFDIVNDEAVAVHWQNLTDAGWRFYYVWRGQDQEFDLMPETLETSIGIPIGQRKWIPISFLNEDGILEDGFDTELDTYSVEGLP